MQKSLDFVLEFTPQAREDIREIVLWYRNEVEGLQDRFLLSLKSSVDLLLDNPLAFQVNFSSIRSILLYRFPYRLYYFIDGISIRILGIIHIKRNPKFIRKRSK